MLLAYLRGLLKPRYDQGMRSVLRESLVLEALSMELDADFIGLQTQIQAAYGPLLQPKAAKELIHKQQVTLQNLRYLVEFDDRITKMTAAISTGEQGDLVALYKALEDAGLVGENATAIPDPVQPKT
jgi:hypothetical protein